MKMIKNIFFVVVSVLAVSSVLKLQSMAPEDVAEMENKIRENKKVMRQNIADRRSGYSVSEDPQFQVQNSSATERQSSSSSRAGVVNKDSDAK